MEVVIHTLNLADWPTTPPELAKGEVIRHRGTDEKTIYNLVRLAYPDVQLLPIAPGTELYTRTGAGCSYILNL